MTTLNPPEDATAEYIPFGDFRAGLPHGRFHVIVNPALAYPFVVRRMNAMPVGVAIAGVGVACALSGYLATGAVLVALAVLLRQWLKRRAPHVLLQLASRLPETYDAATAEGVMEVRRRPGS
ncbi:hypothetical protein LZ009_04850 [Ramlibacter sp. XY19]|uniref:hypothetical protein n=1 Tax=Ramlibacter paludis TaxID=2908000 RepID=UPI0023DC14BB|nr:hypothetical protein [Ramlibacter paludis]MCG2592105.1 hypothetical protein [Ramlibacter paludis]